MDVSEIKEEILQLQAKIEKIPNSEGFDDIWEAEMYEADIVGLIFKYCIEKGYEYEGFPTHYLALIKANDPDFDDFLTFELMDYFVTLMAKQHKDVFELVQLYASYYSPYDENGFEMADIESGIRIYEDKVSFVFDRSDWNSPEIKSKPKLPG